MTVGGVVGCALSMQVYWSGMSELCTADVSSIRSVMLLPTDFCSKNTTAFLCSTKSYRRSLKSASQSEKHCCSRRCVSGEWIDSGENQLSGER
jgi:hypothetical protein